MNKLILFILSCILPFLLIAQNSGKFKDTRDGREYKWVKIGKQTWMAENLAYLPTVSPPIKGVKNEEKNKPFCFVYDYTGNSVNEAKKTINYKTYGVLYNWTMAKNICPSGWHLPSDKEFSELEKGLGMNESELEEAYYRTSGNVGYLLKSKCMWEGNGNGIDKYGFSVLPGGFRHDGDLSKPNPVGGYGFIGTRAYFWTSTESKIDMEVVIRRDFSSSSKGVSRFANNRGQGYSVRCLKD